MARQPWDWIWKKGQALLIRTANTKHEFVDFLGPPRPLRTISKQGFSDENAPSEFLAMIYKFKLLNDTELPTDVRATPPLSSALSSGEMLSERALVSTNSGLTISRSSGTGSLILARNSSMCHATQWPHDLNANGSGTAREEYLKFEPAVSPIYHSPQPLITLPPQAGLPRATMSILREAHDFVINNSDLRVYNQYGSSGIDILREASSPGAAFDSRERSQRRCFPGTREQYIADIMIWAAGSNNSNPSPMFWMRGPAGVGKSSIAQSCAERLKRSGILGAAFFFTVGNFDDPARLFPTLAYQLATVLPEYRAILDDKVYKDKTLVHKTLSTQFQSLILEPLQELETKGKVIPRKAIFVDGLDECADEEAQVEIINIIASSVQENSIPLCWAIFSREEPHIVATFQSLDISSHCSFLFLPISRKVDEEIKSYLRGGFKNILRRRNFLHLASTWPSAEQLSQLVEAAAGLFAFPATILRFVDQHSYSGFMETLEGILNSINKPNPSHPVSPYKELDELYIHIMRRVPDEITPSMRLFLTNMVASRIVGSPQAAVLLCSVTGLSEIGFRSITNHLQAVLFYQGPPQYEIRFGQGIDLTRPYDDHWENYDVKPSASSRGMLLGVHGQVNFHHKSFYDFLIDPARSNNFCVSTKAARENRFNCLIQQHLHYASFLDIQGPKLVRAPHVPKSSLALPWPQGSEFVDSFFLFRAFRNVTVGLSHDNPGFEQFLLDISVDSLRKLADIDYRKFFVALLVDIPELSLTRENVVIGVTRTGLGRVINGTEFLCIHREEYDKAFNPAAFLQIVAKLTEGDAIRPYFAPGGSTHVNLTEHEPRGRQFGQYELGRGEKSTFWYWEFDTEKRYMAPVEYYTWIVARDDHVLADAKAQQRRAGADLRRAGPPASWLSVGYYHYTPPKKKDIGYQVERQ
ncbi:hypothetical protein NP233_g9801 [Leucocoprinus birnbaumii]|uniref:Nephrocystin 3-like N-terminal domain-containing protein n=1 Tax=Leucocoprinus birnbaumii TaxID=56174 RepID=A0AAD5VJR6_9AGAR|nr:hypothetical protein NP233_g9801 [Leucocoprinus birnbaumii]